MKNWHAVAISEGVTLERVKACVPRNADVRIGADGMYAFIRGELGRLRDAKWVLSILPKQLTTAEVQKMSKPVQQPKPEPTRKVRLRAIHRYITLQVAV